MYNLHPKDNMSLLRQGKEQSNMCKILSMGQKMVDLLSHTCICMHKQNISEYNNSGFYTEDL